MKADAHFWQARYRQQVGWSAAARRYLFKQVGLPADACILECGCAGGALLDALRSDDFLDLTGLDLDFESLSLASPNHKRLCADGMRLPFPPAAFEICLCHYYLLWVADPVQALREMRRVARPGGWVMALSEPNYAARLDAPPELRPLGWLQARALAQQGADTAIGARLAGLFAAAGLEDVVTGVLERPACSSLIFDECAWQLEWDVLRTDLAGRLSPAELARYQALDRAARAAGTRELYLPVHYACGRVP